MLPGRGREAVILFTYLEVVGSIPETVKSRCVIAQIALTFKRKREKEFGVRLGKLSGRKDYRKVFGVKLNTGFYPLHENYCVKRFPEHEAF